MDLKTQALRHHLYNKAIEAAADFIPTLQSQDDQFEHLVIFSEIIASNHHPGGTTKLSAMRDILYAIDELEDHD